MVIYNPMYTTTMVVQKDVLIFYYDREQKTYQKEVIIINLSVNIYAFIVDI